MDMWVLNMHHMYTHKLDDYFDHTLLTCWTIAMTIIRTGTHPMNNNVSCHK